MLIKVTTKRNQVFYLEDEDIADYDYKENATSSNDFEIGGAIPRSFDFSIFDHNFKQYEMYGANIKVYKGEEEIEQHLLGTFTINSTDVDQDLITLQSDDDLSNADVKWIGRSFPCTIWELLTNVCNQCNFRLATTKQELPNADIVLTTSSGLERQKCRTILKWIAEANGRFCIMDKNNRLIFKKYNVQSGVKQIAHTDIDNLKLEQTNTTRRGIIINGTKYGDMSYPIIIDDNELLNNLTNANLVTAAMEIVRQIAFLDYYAGSFNCWNTDNYDLAVGDSVSVIDDDGQEYILLVQDLSMNNEDEYFEVQSYGDSVESKNQRKNDTEDNPSSGDNSSGSGGSGDLQMGRVRNHQKIDAKQGRFVLLEKMVKGVNYFSKVNLEFSINFIYTADHFINFEIYANDKLIRTVPVLGTGQLYHAVEAFVADVDYTKDDCLYSVAVNINQNERLTIEPFDAILSLKAVGGTIEDDTATDQLFIETTKKITTGILNQNKFTIKDIQDNELVDIDEYDPEDPPMLLYVWNLGKYNPTDIIGQYYETLSGGAGEIRITIGGPNADKIITNNNIIAELESQLGTSIRQRVVRKTTKILFDSSYSFGMDNTSDTQLFSAYNNPQYTFPYLESVDFKVQEWIPANAFRGQISLKEVKGLNVLNGGGRGKGVSEYAFLGCTNLETVVLSPDTITQNVPDNPFIGTGAFKECTKLSSITGLCSDIGDEAFYDCIELEEVVTPSDFYKIEKIGDRAFYNCIKLHDIDLGGVHSIGDYAFYNCDALDFIDLHNLEHYRTRKCTLGESAFENCTNLYYATLPMVFPRASTPTPALYPPDTTENSAAKNAFKNTPRLSGVVAIDSDSYQYREISPTCFINSTVASFFLRKFGGYFIHVGTTPEGYPDEEYHEWNDERIYENNMHLKAIMDASIADSKTLYVCKEQVESDKKLIGMDVTVKSLFTAFLSNLESSGYRVVKYEAKDEESTLHQLIYGY